MTDKSNMDHEDEVDPRIEMELERMNLAAARINEVEKSLDDARKLHQKFVAQFTSNLSIAKSKVRDNQIKNGECFYLTMREESRLKPLLNQIRYELEQTVELINMIEDGLEKAQAVRTQKKQVKKEVNMVQVQKLRTALMQKTEIEERLKCIDEQHRTVLRVANHESQKHPYHIRKTKQFYELKMKGEEEIDRLSRTVNAKAYQVQTEKKNYHNAMKHLEQISAEIHEKRNKLKLLNMEEPPYLTI